MSNESRTHFKRTTTEQGLALIERPFYTSRLERLRGPGIVKVLTGMRRCGKSGVLRLFQQHLVNSGVSQDSIVWVNLELPENAHLKNPDELSRHLRERQSPSGTTYVLIDEAQETPGIARVAYALQESGAFDLYLTGSHARLVESELQDLMSGRYVEIPIFPLSFAEYHACRRSMGASEGSRELLQRYLHDGGLPYTLRLADDSYAMHDYLDGVYHTVVRRDVSSALGKEDPALLDAISRILMSDMGSPTSANAISRQLTKSGMPCSDDTTARYLSALRDAYAFHRVRRLDLRSQAELKTQERYYASDLGLRMLMLGPGGTSLQGMLENVVYLELRRRHREVHAGKHYGRNIDFVAQDEHGRHYYQVAPSVLDEQTLERKLAPLRAERDNYPKAILTLDEIGLESHEGILQHNLVEWLLAS